MFESEFDYTLERENMEKVRANVAQRWGDRQVLRAWPWPLWLFFLDGLEKWLSGVIIPKTFPQLCTRRVLCMATWHELHNTLTLPWEYCQLPSSA